MDKLMLVKKGIEKEFIVMLDLLLLFLSSYAELKLMFLKMYREI
jgi:hypothetical protein